MPFTIEEVTDRRQTLEFIDLPFRLYRDDPCWVPPVRYFQKDLFDRDSHPFYEHSDVRLLLARGEDGTVAGRIAVIVNHAHNSYHSEKTGFFGFLEGIRDRDVFHALLSAAENRLRQSGMESIRGPMNFSTNEECGLLVKGFDSPPLIMMTYNPPWYEDILKDLEYENLKNLFAYYLDSDLSDYSRIARIAGLVLRRNRLSLRDISVRRIHTEVPIIMDIYNECWKDNWGFVPMTQRELDRMADELKMIMLPELCPIIEMDGEPVAFAVSIPDANQAFLKAGGSLIRAVIALKVPLLRTRISQVRVLLMGVRKACRGLGIEAVLINRIIEASISLGMGRGELSWVLEDNIPMRRILEKDLGADQYRTYRIFQKTL